MYGMIKFEDFEIRKETKYSKLSYYYENEKVDEFELEIIFSKENLEKVDLIKNTDLLSIGEFAQSLKLRGVQFGRNKLHSWLNNRGYT